MTYCERCDRLFGSWSALYRHKADSANHNICEDCSKDFSTWTGLKEHCVESPHHPYCQYCDDHFDDFSDLEDHYEDCHWYCAPCNKIFVDEYGLQEHYCQSNAHYYCLPCKMLFQSASNLKSHANSSIHLTKDDVCPFRGCDMKFVSRSALLLHLKDGACGSGIDRATVKYYATSSSWNGTAYECYLCHRSYASLKSLNQHLKSPVHQDKIYICPSSTCRTRFTTLSALCRHIESESCGVFRFKAVEHAMDSILGQMGHLTL